MRAGGCAVCSHDAGAECEDGAEAEPDNLYAGAGEIVGEERLSGDWDAP